MKNIEKLMYHTCAYTVAISILFFLFAIATGLDDVSIGLGRYLLIFGFSLLISASEFIFALKLHTLLKYAIHYSALCLGFFVIFLSIKSSSGSAAFSAATVFAGIVIFSFIYAFIILAIKLVKNLLKKTKKAEGATEVTQKSYTPRFK